MRPLFSGILLLIGSASLLAQSSSSKIVLTSTPSGRNCPVALAARHSSQGAVELVAQGREHSGIGYTVTFTPFNARAITQAKVTLYGISGAHVMPAADATGSATEDLTLSPFAINSHLFESVVYTGKLTGIQLIELDELTYADGTHWHKSPDSTCFVQPDPLLLVGATSRH